MHSEGLLAGELKHGPLALVDESTPVVLICVRDNCYEKTLNAFSQLLARRVRSFSLLSPSWSCFFRQYFLLILKIFKQNQK